MTLAKISSQFIVSVTILSVFVKMFMDLASGDNKGGNEPGVLHGV
jgi:hypothetical protein